MLCPNCKTNNPPENTNCRNCNIILSQHLPKGHTLASGRYIIGKVLGEGGFGITYEAKDEILSRQVAIKEFFPEGATRVGKGVLPPRSLGLEGFRESKANFIKEAQCLSQFDHEGIVRVLNVVEDNDTTYLVMELLEGQTLAQLINKKGRLSGNEILPIAEKVASALQAVHEAGLLHRDVKPDNIFLTKDNRSVLIDFGSARQFTAHKTSSHTRLVTPGYAPYEQYVSRAKFGPYTDIYALGATLYHALSGQTPPDAPSRALDDKDLPLQTNVPDNLRKAIISSMAIKIDDRPSNSQAFIELLKAPTKPNSSTKSTKSNSSVGNIRRSFDPEELHTLEGHNDYVNSVAFSPREDLLASGSSDATIRLWQPSIGKSLKAFSNRNSWVPSVAFSPDGTMLASKSANNKLNLWRVGDNKKLKTLLGHKDFIFSIAFSPDGSLLASGSEDKTVKLWLIENGQNSNTLLGHDHSVFSIAFSPTGSILASGSGDGTIKLWRVKDGALLSTLTGHSNYIFSVAFHPQGNLLASGSMDGTIKLWRVSDGSLLRTFLGHESWVWSVAFNPKGNLLASGSEDATVKLWSIRSNKNLSTLSSHENFVYSVAFNHDGKVLASGSGDKTIKLWSVPHSPL